MATGGSPAKKFVELFRALQKTRDVPERLELLGLATRVCGDLVICDAVREPFEALEERLKASIAVGRSTREAAEAEGLDVDHGENTYVLYAIFKKGGGRELYVGETSTTAAERFRTHPGGCPKLAEAFDGSVRGKDEWTCVVLFALPEEARSKELLLYLEARLQELLGTVDDPDGLNCHFGAGVFGGEPDEERWLERYVDMIEFVAKHGKTPSKHSKFKSDKALGTWASNQRQTRDKMSTHRRKALDALGGVWKWRINASPVPNAVLFEKLRTDVRVEASGGVHIPTDITGIDAQRVNTARRHYKSGEMSTQDRTIVDSEFPGLKMTAHEAAFWMSAKTFAKKYPSVETLPSWTDDEMYFWLKGVQNGAIAMTSSREKVLESLGLSKILDTLKPPGVRAATVERKNERRAVLNTDRSVVCAERREAKRQKSIDDVALGPPITVE